MAKRQLFKLTPLTVKKKTAQGRYSDGGGLWLQITASGSKSWLFRYTLNKKSHQMGLGPTHTVSLSEAREKALECRKLLLDGFNPLEERKLKRQQANIERAKALTFEECAIAYIEAHESSWKNKKHISQWRSSLATYAYPHFKDMPVAAIDTGLVMKCLEPIWQTKTETATRVRGRIEAVLNWATVREYRSGENPARWRGHLEGLLPKPSKVAKVKHHPALPYNELGNFISSLREHSGISALALEFLILTATRTNEIIGAKWDEIDLKDAIWVIPSHRMKASKEHRIPLSKQALRILHSMKEIQMGDYIFSSKQYEKPLSNMALLMMLRRMKREDITVHGFRSTFRDWCAEQTSYPREIAEQALAHQLADKVEAAYRRTDLLDKRRRLMQDWADYCETLIPKDENDNVIVLIRGNYNE